MVELMVSVTVLSLMMLLAFQMLDETQKTWSRAKGMVASFKDARNGFETMNRVVSQATLNTFLGYDFHSGSEVPSTFQRKSELHFVCGPAKALLARAEGRHRVTHAIFFQAPLGFQTITARSSGSGTRKDQYAELDNLLNGLGYYVEYGSDEAERPQFLTQMSPPVPPKWRYRLMEFRQPAEATTIYQYHLDAQDKVQQEDVWRWFRSRDFGVDSPANLDPISSAGQIRTTRVVADNIIALVISPRLSENDLRDEGGGGAASRFQFKEPTDIAPNYFYDSREYQYGSSGAGSKTALFSRHQIPPVLRVTMIAVDEVDADRYAARTTEPSTPPDYAPDDKYFQSVDRYGEDLADLTAGLDQIGIRYRVFTSNIRMREGNFSKVY